MTRFSDIPYHEITPWSVTSEGCRCRTCHRLYTQEQVQAEAAVEAAWDNNVFVCECQRGKRDQTA